MKPVTGAGGAGGMRDSYQSRRAEFDEVMGAGVALIGLVVQPLRVLYDYSWFVGFAVSFVAYYVLMKPNGSFITHNAANAPTIP